MRRRRFREGERARTEQPRKSRVAYRDLLSDLYPQPEFDVERPKTRADCLKMERPCPFVSCRHHLYLDLRDGRQSVKFNFPDKEPWDIDPSCALDLADRGPMILDEVGVAMNLTRERVRQIEEEVLERLGLDADGMAKSIEWHRQDGGPWRLTPTEAEVEILKAAKRLAEIEDEIGELKIERRSLIVQMATIARRAEATEALEDEAEGVPQDDQDVPVINRATGKEVFVDVEEWVLSILRGGHWVPTRKLSATLPSDLVDGQNPSKLIQKAIKTLTRDGRIERGKVGGHSRSWRLVTP